jgi:NADPH:quinone reductase-like Zn-dependent oxidoreductase
MAPGDGALAERCAVPDADVVPVTAGLPDTEVAALGLSAVAAWMALTWRGRFTAGERVLVLGGGGDALTERLRAAVGGAVDVVVDPVFGAAATAAARVLAPGGRLVNLGGASGDEAAFSSTVLRSRSAEVLGYTNNALTPEQRAEALAAVLGHAAQGRLGVAHEVLPLAAVERAWHRQAAGDVGVRFVLTPWRPVRRSGSSTP